MDDHVNEEGLKVKEVCGEDDHKDDEQQEEVLEAVSGVVGGPEASNSLKHATVTVSSRSPIAGRKKVGE